MTEQNKNSTVFLRFGGLFLLIAGCVYFFGCDSQELPIKIQNSLNQTTNYIDAFHTKYSRLPTRNEWLDWWKTNDIRGVDDYHIDSEKTNEYELHIWLGERGVIYSSKTMTIREP